MADLSVKLYGFGNACLTECLAKSHIFIPFYRRGHAKYFEPDVDLRIYLN